jgi:hypothetical protein
LPLGKLLAATGGGGEDDNDINVNRNNTNDVNDEHLRDGSSIGSNHNRSVGTSLGFDPMEIDQIEGGINLESTLRATEAAFSRSATISNLTNVIPKAELLPQRSSSSSGSSLLGGLVPKNMYSPSDNNSTGELNLSLSTATTQYPGRKFRLFIVPYDHRERQNTYFRLIGEGSTVCARMIILV